MQALTTREVAAFTGLDEKSVWKDVEQGVVEAVGPPRFSDASVLYFYARSLFAFQLSVKDRKRLHTLITDAVAKGAVRLDLGAGWTLDVGSLAEELRQRLEAFARWKDARVLASPDVLGGEPVFRGTRLAVRHIGQMLLRGASHHEVLEDYAYLTAEDLEFAPIYAAAYPRLGRPRA